MCMGGGEEKKGVEWVGVVLCTWRMRNASDRSNPTAFKRT